MARTHSPTAMIDFTPPLARLIEELKKIPGIGRKSAQRIAFYLLRTEKKNALALADAIVQAREKIFILLGMQQHLRHRSL